MNHKILSDCIHVFERANSIFLNEQRELIISGVSERSLCGQLMVYLLREIKKTEYANYHVDIEYNRNYGGKVKTIKDGLENIISVTCDLIIHSRGENIRQDNLIAFEMKKSTNTRKEKEKDRERLMTLTRMPYDNVYGYEAGPLPEHVCGYILGVYYEINIRRRLIQIEYYVQGALERNFKISF